VIPPDNEKETLVLAGAGSLSQIVGLLQVRFVMGIYIIPDFWRVSSGQFWGRHD